MRTMQDKILAAIGAATANDVELVVKAQYANTGKVYAQRGFDTLVELYYSFQDDYCTITMTGPVVVAAKAALPQKPRYGDTMAWPALKYVDGDTIREMIGIWRQLCNTPSSYSTTTERN